MKTVLLCGIPSEPPMALAREACERHGIPYALFNQREFDRVSLELELANSGLTGELVIGGITTRVEDVAGIYTRLGDFQLLPELRGVPGDHPRYLHCSMVHHTFHRWCETHQDRVANRSRAMASNASKPYQAQLIRNFFPVPETLVTNVEADVLAFWREHKRIIYKSTSGMRSIVQEFSEKDAARLEHLDCCPVQFQRFIEGQDVRVHVVGTTTFGTLVESSAVDYRYGHRDGHQATLSAVEIPGEVSTSCVALTRALGMEFTGIDLRMAADGEWYCFEVNPSPAYSYYQENTGQPIADVLVQYLCGGG